MKIYKVTYRRRSGMRRNLRVDTYQNIHNIEDKEYRLALIRGYNKTNKRVLKIEIVDEVRNP